MSIKDFALKIKPFFTIGLVLLGALLFFGLGRLSAQEKNYSPVTIVKTAVSPTLQNIEIPEIASVVAEGVASGEVIGSKNGTKYYLPWCGALSRIKPENRVTFASVALARQAGYTPAANCKGTK